MRIADRMSQDIVNPLDKLFVQPRIARELRDSLMHVRNLLEEHVDEAQAPADDLVTTIVVPREASREPIAVG